MRFISKVSSFLLDAAVGLVGAAFVGLSATMFDHDIQTAKRDREEKKHENQD